MLSRVVEGGSLPASPGLHHPWGSGPLPRLPLLERHGLPAARTHGSLTGGGLTESFLLTQNWLEEPEGQLHSGPAPMLTTPLGDLGG